MGGTKKYQNIMYTVGKYSGRDWLFYRVLIVFFTFKVYLLLLLFFLVLKMIEANCHCLRQMLFINKKPYINLREKGYNNHETDLKYTCILE